MLWYKNNHTKDIMKRVGWHKDRIVLRSIGNGTAHVHPVDLARHWTPIHLAGRPSSEQDDV